MSEANRGEAAKLTNLGATGNSHPFHPATRRRRREIEARKTSYNAGTGIAMMLDLRGVVTFAACLFLAGFGEASPNGLYVTTTWGGTLGRIDGDTMLTFGGRGAGDSPIVVSGDVRTASSAFYAGGRGARYDLNGEWLGTTYAAYQHTGYQQYFWDAATDGSRNFLMNAGLSGGVFVSDRNWENTRLLFETDPAVVRRGITYDPTDQSLWVVSKTGTFEQYDLAGNRLRMWDSRIGAGMGLAMDYSDGTLWVYCDGDWLFHQFDRAGNHLSAFGNYDLGVDLAGAEFNVVPEPSTLLTLFLLARLGARKLRWHI